MVILTSGKKYIDIDAYASCIAYRELLLLRGIEAKFVSTAVLNYSITKSLLDISYTIDDYEVNDDDKFIVIDVSNKDFFEDFVRDEKIEEIIDHHPGSEVYWEQLLGDNSHIEPIGSVATIIVEKYEQYNLIDKMNRDIAKLLMAAILDNTLNFTAKITKERDKVAYEKLRKISQEDNFDELYFSECQRIIDEDLETSIINDLKIEEVSEFLPKVLGQLTIWEIAPILEKDDIIEKVMNRYGNKWLINIISLKDNCSYILCSNLEVENNVKRLFNCKSIEKYLIIRPGILRKEIIKRALEYDKEL